MKKQLKNILRVIYFPNKMQTTVLDSAKILSMKKIIHIHLLILFFLMAIGCSIKDTYDSGTTLGSIVVDSPEVYTRERLVNDRFQQDSWLRKQLDETDQQNFGHQGLRDFRSASGKLSRIGINLSPTLKIEDNNQIKIPQVEKSEQLTPEGLNTKDTESKKTFTIDPAITPTAAKYSPADLFRDRLAYREEIRNEIIQNQLDDRHDLVGNTLYRLKFDATVIPGADTSAWAVVLAKVSNPFQSSSKILKKLAPSDDQLESIGKKLGHEKGQDWFRLYSRVINSTETTLNEDYETYKAQFQDFFHKKSIDKSDPNWKLVSELVHYIENETFIQPYAKDDYSQIRKLVYTKSDTSSDIKVECKKNVGFAPDIINLEYLKCLEEGFELRDGSRTTLLGILYAHIMDKFLNDIFSSSFHENSFSKGRLISFSMLVEPMILGSQNYKIQVYRRAETKELWRRGVQALEAPIESRKAVEKQLNQEALEIFKMEEKKVENNYFLHISKNEKLQENGVKEIFSIQKIVEKGLYYFIYAILEEIGHVYSYSVTPKEAVQRISDVNARRVVSQHLLSLSALAGKVGVETAMNYIHENQNIFHAIRRQPLVVGFGRTPKEESTTFGWLIGPRVRINENSSFDKGIFSGLFKGRTSASFRHFPAQNSLSAIVSVPSWMEKLKLEIQTFWLNEDSTVTPSQPLRPVDDEAIEHTIMLPQDPDSIAATFLGTEKRSPTVFEKDMEISHLIVGKKASILIPGRHLWRSTVVTLGNQLSRNITVLPNMKGIMATFDPLEAPADWPVKSQPYTKSILTIWTSQDKAIIKGKVWIHEKITQNNKSP